MPVIDGKRLRHEALKLGILLQDDQILLLDKFAQQLLEVNKTHNLTAITDPREMEIKHFLDCLALCAMPELGNCVLDIGTGAGFPGVVIAVARKDCTVTMMEARKKKVEFVESLCRQLCLSAIVIQGRAEEIHDPKWLGRFDAVVARAVAPLPRLVPLALPYIKKGGTLIAMKGPKAQPELEQTLPMLSQWGVRWQTNRQYTLPGELIRTAVIMKKTR